MGAALVAVIGVTAVATSKPTKSSSGTISAATFEYTCCSSELVGTVFHPGHAITIHWERVETPSTRRQDMVISSVLVGPFATVKALKHAVAADTYATPLPWQHARSIELSNTGVRSPTSTIHIPLDATPGFYDLQTSTLWKGTGNSVAAGSVLHLTP